VNTPSGISTGTLNGVAWLTVEGRGSFQNSAELRGLVREGIAGGTSRMVLDLLRCSGMDSTFMGMLSCIAIKLEDAGGCLHVVNAEGKNGELLRGLGLDEVFRVEDGTAGVPAVACCSGSALDGMPLEVVAKAPCTAADQREICLQAHEALAGIQETNAEKFRDVISLMRQKSLKTEAAH